MGICSKRILILVSTTLAGLLTVSLAACTSGTASASAASQPQATAPALPVAAPVTIPAPLPTPQELAAAQRQKQIDTLIHQVETAYDQGQADYRKGKLPEAKDDFDRAVDLMLASGIDIRSEARLDEEFNRIVDGVNALEMEALKQGNGFVPPEDPTPAEAASDVTFVVDPQLLAKAKADLATTKSDLPLVVNDYVASFINFFANTKKGHNTLLHSLQRGGRYKAMIQRAMAEEGVPQDLIYLAVAESSFNPRALNAHSHAGGMWQFMPNDKFYGLKRTAYVDERFDPEKSTRAYARYMKFIYNQLGDWYLSMAAYDHGTGNIQKEVERTGYADFWELYKRNNLPTETKNYVPEILAAIIIANNPLKYGFDDITLDAPVLTDTVTINYSTDLRLVSDITQAPMEEMMALNPSLLRRITPPDAPFDLHLPAGTAALFEKEMARIPEAKRIAWRYRRVHDGDTLAAVAREYHVSQSELADANQLEDSAALTGIDALVVPTAPAAAPATAALMYTSRKGDTLVTIADKFGVSLDQLRHWNKLTGYKIEPGRRLRVGEAVTAPRLPRSHRHGSSASTSKTKTSKMSSTSETAAPSSEAKSTTKTGKTSTSKKHRSASSASGSKSTSKSDSKPATAAKKPSSTSKTKSTTHKKQSTKSKTTTTKN